MESGEAKIHPRIEIMIRLIRDRTDYNEALKRLDVLMRAAPAPNSPESDELEVLSVLISDYDERHTIDAPVDPLDAIRFRMDQLDLKPRDLVPYLGARSRVSEVLAGKRPLSVSMIRSLHRGLGIPLTSLLGEGDPNQLEERDIQWERFPVREMASRGWLVFSEHSLGTTTDKLSKSLADQTEQLLQDFFRPIGGPATIAALYRKSEHVRSARTMDGYALAAWTARVLLVALDANFTRPFNADAFTEHRIRELVQLSRAEDGPVQAMDFLREWGVAVVVEPHLPRTRLDGAAMCEVDGRPVIGLTLRHDRIDNFWFTLLHELAHILRHIGGSVTATNPDAITRFYDDLDVEVDVDPLEREADMLAGEWLVPRDAWERSAARYVKSPEAVTQLANQIAVNPAIVAGKVRHFFKDYRALNTLVGHNTVRRFFPKIQWQS